MTGTAAGRLPRAAAAVAPQTRAGNRRMYGDAMALAGSSSLSAGLGMLFWLVAARAVHPAGLGIQTALLSAITAPAIVIGTGVGDAFVSLLPRAGASRLKILRAGYRQLGLTAAATGLVSGLASVTFLPGLRGSVTTVLLVLAGTTLWSYFVVQDCALTAMGRARWLPIENGLVSVGKIGFLPVLAVSSAFGPAVVTATLLPALIAVLLMTPSVFRLAAAGEDTAPAPELAAEATALAWRLMTAGAMTIGAMTLLPFVVTAVAGPAEGAIFALCLTIVQGLDFVSAALGVSLVVHHAGLDDAPFPRVARAVLARTALLVTAGAVGLSLIAPVALPLLGETYAGLGGARIIAILSAAAVPRTLFIIWAALQRARRTVRPLLRVNAMTVIVLYSSVGLLASRFGGVGAAGGLLIAQVWMTTCAALHIFWTYRRGNTRSSRRGTA
ncbi:lipopolysaccharide biosynthesis protein [Couchioplanes azureus]|uniref:lipopolysaccharide biosynthesis protein n=1 Tax=Couchioplanes caeruleus TaxID=56438 RepID=UPI00166FDED4|nr:hypothetical protein [Couchioplanes caeruleus]GGQ40405.1 hypothetical protein GCM10010166_04360 [Couchioplanes caeruleus subsp. azureus]